MVMHSHSPELRSFDAYMICMFCAELFSVNSQISAFRDPG
jgi:hypothetical protein